jgi:hypothetical protein
MQPSASSSSKATYVGQIPTSDNHLIGALIYHTLECQTYFWTGEQWELCEEGEPHPENQDLVYGNSRKQWIKRKSAQRAAQRVEKRKAVDGECKLLWRILQTCNVLISF